MLFTARVHGFDSLCILGYIESISAQEGAFFYCSKPEAVLTKKQPIGCFFPCFFWLFQSWLETPWGERRSVLPYGNSGFDRDKSNIGDFVPMLVRQFTLSTPLPSHLAMP
jgi:hypothetical protein